MVFFKKKTDDKPSKNLKMKIMPFKKKKERSNKPIFKKKGNGFVSLDFGESSIKFVVGDYADNQIKVSKLFSCHVPDGAYKSGHIKEEEIISSLIDETLKKNKISTKNFIATLESMEIIKREMTVPVLGYEDIVNYIRYEIEEYLPIDISTHILQFKEVKRYTYEDTEKMEVIVYAFPRDMAQSYYNVFNKLKLNPCILDVYSNGIEKLFSTQSINGNKIGKEPIAVVDFDKSTTSITILKDGKYDFSRILDTSNSLTTELISKELLDEKGADNFVNRFKNESIFEDFLDGDDAQFQQVVVGTIDNCVSEVNKIFKYWASRSQDNRLSRIYLIGEYIDIIDIDLYFEAKLGISTEKIERIGNNINNSMFGQEKISEYVNAISALIRRD